MVQYIFSLPIILLTCTTGMLIFKLSYNWRVGTDGRTTDYVPSDTVRTPLLARKDRPKSKHWWAIERSMLADYSYSITNSNNEQLLTRKPCRLCINMSTEKVDVDYQSTQFSGIDFTITAWLVLSCPVEWSCCQLIATSQEQPRYCWQVFPLPGSFSAPLVMNLFTTTLKITHKDLVENSFLLHLCKLLFK